MPNSKGLQKSESKTRKSRDYHYSPEETRAYYERIQAKCLQNGIQFTTCYIGNGENQFWRDQDLWSNKKDCCNAKERVPAFKTDSRSIDWDIRMKHTSQKCLIPNDSSKLHSDLGPIIIVKDGKAQINRDFLNA